MEIKSIVLDMDSLRQRFQIRVSIYRSNIGQKIDLQIR